MTGKELASKALNLAKNYKTVYANGFIGAIITEDGINAKAKQLPNWYTADRKAHLRTLIGKGYFGFDCVCMIKSLLWGWNGDASKTYGGAVYASNGMPDATVEQVLEVCNGVSTDFSNVQEGEFLWLPGHCGLYVGNGLSVECTGKWRNGVQITAIENMGKKSTEYQPRTWVKHGKMPYVTYTASTTPSTPAVTTGKENDIKLLTLRRGENRLNPQITTAQILLKHYGFYKMDIDGAFGPGMETAVKNFQTAKKLNADGIIGVDTWTALLK